MRNKTTILIIFLLFSLNSFTQDILGKYTRNNDEYLNFLPNNRIDFLLERPGCFGIEKLTGEGNYKLNKDKITIKVNTHRKEFESTFQQVPQKQQIKLSEFEFLIKDEENKAIPFAYVTYKNSENEDEGTVSDENGLAKLSIPVSLNSEIEISFVGFTSAFIPIQDLNSKRIVVTLKIGSTFFLDNSRVKMKFKLNDENRTFEIEKIKIK